VNNFNNKKQLHRFMTVKSQQV